MVKKKALYFLAYAKNIKGLLFDPGLPVKSVLFPASSSGRRTFGPRKRARGGMFVAAGGAGAENAACRRWSAKLRLRHDKGSVRGMGGRRSLPFGEKPGPAVAGGKRMNPPPQASTIRHAGRARDRFRRSVRRRFREACRNRRRSRAPATRSWCFLPAPPRRCARTSCPWPRRASA